MNRFLLASPLLALGLSFCFLKPKDIKFIIVNSSEKGYDSLIIKSYKLQENFLSINPKDSFERKTIFSVPPGNGEGGFSVFLYRKDSLIYGNVFGYYTDASFVKYIYKITIFNDKKIIINNYD